MVLEKAKKKEIAWMIILWLLIVTQTYTGKNILAFGNNFFSREEIFVGVYATLFVLLFILIKRI